MNADRRRLRVDEAGNCLLVSMGGVVGSAKEVARTLPAEVGRVAVVMPDAHISLMPELARRLSEWVPDRWASVRLVAERAAAADADGRSPAQELSELLGVEVVAPDGDLLAVPGGSLFVVGKGVASGAWWRFRPGRTPEAGGMRFPVPEWERYLSVPVDVGGPGVVVQQIPAGFWVRWPGEATHSDLAFAVSVHTKTPVLLVSRAGHPPLRADDVSRVIEALPEPLRDRLVVIPYGDNPIVDRRLGAVVSLAANQTLRVRTGMPLHVPGHGTQLVAVGPDGAPTWSPFARELAWRPHGGARVLKWTPPAGHLLPVGPAQLALNERWIVEIVEAGLWVREIDRLDGAEAVRQLPLDSRQCTVVVGTPGDEEARIPMRALARLLRRLPAEAQERLVLAVPEKADDVMVRSAAATFARVRPGASVHLLTSDGRLVPLPSNRDASRANAHREERLEAHRGRVEPQATTGARGVSARPSKNGVPQRRRGGAAASHEVADLLSFVEELRHTPAWDEIIANGEAQASDVANGDRRRHGSPPVPAPHPDGTRVVDPREWPSVVPVPNHVVIEDQAHRAADARDEDGTASVEGGSGSTETGHHGAHRWTGVSGVDQ